MIVLILVHVVAKMMRIFMLTSEGCRLRRERLWNAIKVDLDWILIGDPQHQTYFANYYADPFVFRSVNSSAALLLHQTAI